MVFPMFGQAAEGAGQCALTIPSSLRFAARLNSGARQHMATLVWTAPMRYYSSRDEAAFFGWLESIPGVVSVRGQGRELHVQLRSRRPSRESLLELISLYRRYEGNFSELAKFENDSNRAWFRDGNAYWFEGVFGGASGA
jgi:hypothetical protein